MKDTTILLNARTAKDEGKFIKFDAKMDISDSGNSAYIPLSITRIDENHIELNYTWDEIYNNLLAGKTPQFMNAMIATEADEEEYPDPYGHYVGVETVIFTIPFVSYTEAHEGADAQYLASMFTDGGAQIYLQTENSDRYTNVFIVTRGGDYLPFNL